MNYTNIVLTVLSIATGILAIVTFFNNRSKDTKNSGQNQGILLTDVTYIKEMLVDIRDDVKDMNRMLDSHSVEIAKVQQDIKSAHKRIDEAINRIEIIEKYTGGARQ